MQPKVDFVLYIDAESATCRQAVATMEQLLQSYASEDVGFTVKDVRVEPLSPEEQAQIVSTPTLVKRSPAPRTRIVGALSTTDFVKDLLHFAGVAPR